MTFIGCICVAVLLRRNRGIGAELASAIRNELTDRSLQIVAVTADASVTTNFQMKNFDGILYKPVTLDKLKNILAEITPKKQLINN